MLSHPSFLHFCCPIVFCCEMSPLEIHLTFNGHLNYFCVFDILNNTSMDFLEQIFVYTYSFSSLGNRDMIRISGWCYETLIATILRNCWKIFNSSLILSSNQQRMRVLISVHSYQHMIFLCLIEFLRFLVVQDLLIMNLFWFLMFEIFFCFNLNSNFPEYGAPDW